MQCRSFQTLMQTLNMQNNVTSSYGMSELSVVREKTNRTNQPTKPTKTNQQTKNLSGEVILNELLSAANKALLKKLFRMSRLWVPWDRMVGFSERGINRVKHLKETRLATLLLYLHLSTSRVSHYLQLAWLSFLHKQYQFAP